MRDLKYILKPKYDSSRALVIGINDYQHASPLGYAVNDAEEIKEILINELGFESSNVIYLIDQEASKANILKAFLSFTTEDIKVDDRLIVFFAGHGYTKPGFRGDVGFLVPYDANMDDFSSFIRWDELTRNADLIRAKHILFIMDACYGGLAVNRELHSGNSRFLKDMYLRFSRQVITAGKADEVVADSGGPIPNHSIFTGHLIEGIKGKAANEFGIITASGLMSYIYTKVANDINSEQTPHYGQIDGDGDLIISAPNYEEAKTNGKKEMDVLVSIPHAEVSINESTLKEKIVYFKELLSTEKAHIKLYDFTIDEIRRFLALTSEDNFANSDEYSLDMLLERIGSYEEYTKDLATIIAVLAYWAKESEHTVLSKLITKSTDRLLEHENGLLIWINLRWYPILLLMYSAGIAAIDSKNYYSLSTLLYTKLGESKNGKDENYFASYLTNAIHEMNRAEVFKNIPGHKNNFSPLSEYLYKHIQPILEDVFFLGHSYETSFDEFEVLFALAIADLEKQSGRDVWGPVGRFGWKRRSYGNSPLNKVLSESESMKDQWGPIRAGMFGGSYKRFEEISKEFKAFVERLNWF